MIQKIVLILDGTSFHWIQAVASAPRRVLGGGVFATEYRMRGQRLSSRLNATVAWGNALLRRAEGIAAGRSHQTSRKLDRRVHAGRSAGKRRVVVYGAGACGRKLLDAVRFQSKKELQILGVFDDRMTPAANRTEWPEVSGNSDDLIRLAQTEYVHEVIIAVPEAAGARLSQLVEKFCVLPAAITLYDGLAAGGLESESGVLRRRALLRSRQSGFYHSAKALLDPLLASLAIVVTLPLLLMIALLIKLDTPGPALFCQARYGFKGRIFRLYKFRTLFHDRADPLGATQTHPGDERVTRIGAVLRRICLDELLFNVVKGDMSLVGPRPHPIGM